jgi:hypothetical protein
LILLGCSLGVLCPRLPAQSQALAVERRGNYLHVAVPQLHLLEGKPLERLHNGASVTYVFSLTLTADRSSAATFRLQERFIVSFDLWEEKFSVVQAGSSGRSGSHLTADLAEAWCLDNLPVPVAALPAEKTFVIKLEWAVAENESENSSESRSGLTLAGLIDVFSRKGREASPRWQAVSGHMRLADLKDKKGNKSQSRITRSDNSV